MKDRLSYKSKEVGGLGREKDEWIGQSSWINRGFMGWGEGQGGYEEW